MISEKAVIGLTQPPDLNNSLSLEKSNWPRYYRVHVKDDGLAMHER